MTEFDSLPMHPMDEYSEYRLVPTVAVDFANGYACSTCLHGPDNEAANLCTSTPCPGGIYMNKGDFIALILEGKIDHEQFKRHAPELRKRFGPRVPAKL